MKYFLWFLRIVVGVLFIFSGLVKANDPLGLNYKMIEVFEIWHMQWLANYAMQFSILMIAFELIAGVAVLLGAGFRVFSFLLLLLNIFFTFLTGYALVTDKIHECGCFGACIPLTNTETFSKDIVLLVMSIILFMYRKRITPLFSKYTTASLMILSTFAAFGIQWWALEHLPFNDCLAYKAGNNIWQKMQAPTGPGIVTDSFETVMIYEKKDGTKQEFTMKNYPWQDTINWKFVDSKSKLVRKGNADPEVKDFSLTDADGGDHTQDVLTAKGYTFLWFVRDPEKADTRNLDKLHAIVEQSVKYNIPFYSVYSASKEDSKKYQDMWKLSDIPFYLLDGTVSKTAMRSNPGLFLLKDGVVVHKWSYMDYPKVESFDNGTLKLK